MKTKGLLFILNLIILNLSSQAQISHGGEPFFLERSLLKSSTQSFFIEMPPFDVNTMLEEDKLNESNMKGAFRFAKKFFTDIEKGKSGLNYTLPDGTKVWQVGIRSTGAYSINVLFSEYHIPEGAKLFLYSSDKSDVLGSFTSENNSEDNILPISPVSGDEIIIEYTEPAHTIFEGKLKISEVNHDYKGILKSEPKNDLSGTFACMPDILCATVNAEVVNSHVLLIINGNVLCSGALLNNTANDGKPYLLTAMHCFNYPLLSHRTMDFYIQTAGTIVAFFNYNRPVCNTNLRGTEEMSVARSFPRVVNESHDIALLELQETPPAYYKPYYAGWNINPDGGALPHFNIHHPEGTMAKYGESNKPITIGTFNTSPFEPNAHWMLPGWTTGSTYGGSSGSPLFDNDNYIIGSLTGGSSFCSGNSPNGGTDYFAALYKGWDSGPDSLHLKPWLDPGNKGITKCPGFDPYTANPYVRVGNVNYNSGDALSNTLINGQTGNFLFGTNNSGLIEFAEEFNLTNEAQVLGAFLINPIVAKITNDNIRVYLRNATGEGMPGDSLTSVIFRPQYANYSTSATPPFSGVDKTMLDGAESFVKFDAPHAAGKKFFITYKFEGNVSGFSIYNTTLSSGKSNTAWLKKSTGWFTADDQTKSPQPTETSLAIQPLLQYLSTVNITDPAYRTEQTLWYSRPTQTLYSNISGGINGILEIYTITGQPAGSFRCKNVDSFTIPNNILSKGQVGIIRLLSPENVRTIKVVF